MEIIIPIIEDLTAHNVSPNTPAVLVALLCQPIVSQKLGVKIDCLERGVMDVRFRPFEEEEAVMVNRLQASIQMQKGGDISSLVIIDQLDNGENVN